MFVPLDMNVCVMQDTLDKTVNLVSIYLSLSHQDLSVNSVKQFSSITSLNKWHNSESNAYG